MTVMRVTLVSWNMDHWKTNKAHRREAWDYLLGDLAPDVALLQEAVPPADLGCSRQIRQALRNRHLDCAWSPVGSRAVTEMGVMGGHGDTLVTTFHQVMAGGFFVVSVEDNQLAVFGLLHLEGLPGVVGGHRVVVAVVAHEAVLGRAPEGDQAGVVDGLPSKGSRCSRGSRSNGTSPVVPCTRRLAVPSSHSRHWRLGSTRSTKVSPGQKLPRT